MSKIFVVSGPSGSGKTTLLERLLGQGQVKNKLIKSVSFTTRPKRSSEREGEDYFFITEKRFNQMRAAKKVLEWTRYLGYYYGTPKDFLKKQLAEGRNLALCLDLKGALRLKRLYPRKAVTIFILPPSLATLKERIQKRCRETKAGEVQKRLKIAGREILSVRHYDYCLINKKLQETTRKLKEIVLRELMRG